MDSAFVILFLWVLFAGTHIGLGLVPVRMKIISAIGRVNFMIVFSVVAVLTFGSLILYFESAPISEYSSILYLPSNIIRPLMFVLSPIGVLFMTFGLCQYLDSSAASLSGECRPPVGIYKVTRHPFFLGVSITSFTHSMFSPSLSENIFFLGFTIYPLLGAFLQDLKLSKIRGNPYDQYVGKTSFFPLVAIFQGKQKLALKEFPVWIFSVTVAATVLIRFIHPYYKQIGGSKLVLLGFILGPGYFLFVEVRRLKRIKT